MAVTKEELAEYNKKRDKEEAFKKKQGEATEKAKSKAQEAKKQTGKKPWEIGTAPGEPGYISKEELDRRDKNRQKSKEADKEQRRKSYDAEQKKAQKSIKKANVLMLSFRFPTGFEIIFIP